MKLTAGREIARQNK